MLRRIVLLRPSEADAAWVILIEECARLATLHSTGDRRHLRTILERTGISTRAPRSYQKRYTETYRLLFRYNQVAREFRSNFDRP
jgi:hypothetical protein